MYQEKERAKEHFKVLPNRKLGYKLVGGVGGGVPRTHNRKPGTKCTSETREKEAWRADFLDQTYQWK